MNGLTIIWAVLTPVLAPAVAALAVLVVDAVSPRLGPLTRLVGLAGVLVGLGAAVGQGFAARSTDRLTLCLPAPDGRCFYDPGSTGSLLQVGTLLSALVVLLLLWRRDTGDAPTQLGGTAVTTALVLATTAGATTVAAAVDVGTWLVGLELATLPVIALVGLRGTARASHGALSLLTTALVSFALLVVGVALWVVATGEPTFSGPAAAVAWGGAETRAVLLVSVLFLIAGLGFKVSAVPFHAWTPQAYAGSSVPVAALLATVSKIAAVAGLLAVLRAVTEVSADGEHPHQIAFLVAVLAVATMTLGNVVALRQDDALRLLAWSTIAQGGWVVLPLASLQPSGSRAAAAYVVAYAVASLVVFAVVEVVGPALPDYRGLLRGHHLLGGALLLGLVSLAGLPPGVIGLIAKVVALRPVLGAGLWPLAVLAVANAVIGIAVYLRWVAILFGDPEDGSEPHRIGRPARLALALSTAALVVTSVAPQLLLGLMAAS